MKVFRSPIIKAMSCQPVSELLSQYDNTADYWLKRDVLFPWGCMISNMFLSNISKQASLALHRVCGDAHPSPGQVTCILGCSYCSCPLQVAATGLLCRRSFQHCNRSAHQSTDIYHRRKTLTPECSLPSETSEKVWLTSALLLRW